MNAVKQTQKMMTLLNEKLTTELGRLEEAFEKKDFTLLLDASKQLNLYAHRGYDLTVSSNDYARFKRTSRQEFFEMVQSEFESAGIEIVFPANDGYSGEAIYFKAFGERLAVLYADHGQLIGEVGNDNTEHLDYVLKGHKKRYKFEMEKTADFDKRISVFERLLENPALILTDEFASERKESHQMGRVRFRNQTIQKAYDKYFYRMADRHAGKQLMKEIQSPESQERMKSRLEGIREQKEQHLQAIEQYKKKVETLEAHAPKFEGTITSFFSLMKKYKIAYRGKE